MGLTLENIHSPLFEGIRSEDREAMLNCIGYHIRFCPKGQTISMEAETLRQVGLVLSGAVDMVKEDLWGNRTLLLRIRKNELFGETFACGEDPVSVVTFTVSEDSDILFLPFHRVMCTCTHSCAFHQQLTMNMVRIIARKNRDLMRKVEVISKKTIREKILTYLSIQSQAQQTRYFEIPLGRLEWADYLCVDRSALTRELVKMKQEGIIDFDRNCFRIL